MSDQPVLLHLPEDLYERIRQLAEDAQRPVENMLVDSLELLFGSHTDLTAQQIDALSDEQLWAIVYRPLAWPQDTRLRALTALGKQGALSVAEQQEVEQLVAQVDRYVLVRSQALIQLKQRGYDVEQRLKLGS